MSFGEVSAFLAVLAIGVYVLGLLSLWVPLTRTYTGGGYSTAWYAVSLIPRTTIIGQGMMILGSPLVMSLLYSATYISSFLLYWCFKANLKGWKLFLLVVGSWAIQTSLIGFFIPKGFIPKVGLFESGFLAWFLPVEVVLSLPAAAVFSMFFPKIQ